MEVAGAILPQFPVFLGFTPDKVTLRRLPPASTLSRSGPPPCLPHTPAPQRRGNRGLASPAGAAAEAPPIPPEPVEGEARAILRDFLLYHEMPGDLAEQQVPSWNEVVELLSSKLRSLHESEQQIGVRLNQSQLLNLFKPYLTSVLKEYADIDFIEGDEQLPSAPVGEKAVGEAPSKWSRTKKKAISRLEMQLSQGCPPTFVLHLMNLSLGLREIRSMIYLYPSIFSVSMEQKLDPLMEFLISYGVPESTAPVILRRYPHLLGIGIKETMIPIMASLESNGVSKEQFPKIIYRCPQVFTQSTAKIEAVVGYFSEIGLSAEDIGRMLTCSPGLLCMSIETKIKPMIMFFFDIGFTLKEVQLFLEFGSIFGLNLERNLKPKWEFFLTTCYSRQDLVKYPIYFSLSLEKRIKPRYRLAMEHGIRWSLPRLLVPSNPEFEYMIEAQKHGEDA